MVNSACRLPPFPTILHLNPHLFPLSSLFAFSFGVSLPSIPLPFSLTVLFFSRSHSFSLKRKVFPTDESQGSSHTRPSLCLLSTPKQPFVILASYYSPLWQRVVSLTHPPPFSTSTTTNQHPFPGASFFTPGSADPPFISVHAHFKTSLYVASKHTNAYASTTRVSKNKEECGCKKKL